MSFPVEPTDSNRVVAAAGVAVRNEAAAPPEIRELIGDGKRFHLHGTVFSREPLSREIDRFDDELTRVLNELEVFKVEHLLAQSRFGGGLAAIVELEA